MSRTLLIINPSSGRGSAKAASELLVESLSSQGRLDVVVTSGCGDAERAARSAARGSVSRVVAAGGDGTVNEVVNGLAGSDVELGIIALGTANVLARDLGLPLWDAPAAVDVVKSGTIRQIDLARCRERHFAAMAGFGFDAAVVRRVNPRVKDLIGASAYGFAIAGALARLRPSRFLLDLDGQRFDAEASLVIVANSASYACDIKVATRAALDDGLLDVIVFEKAWPAKIALVRQALRVLAQTHLADPDIRYFRARNVTVQAAPDVPMQLDGDVTGATPAEIEVLPAALKVVVPPRS